MNVTSAVASSMSVYAMNLTVCMVTKTEAGDMLAAVGLARELLTGPESVLVGLDQAYNYFARILDNDED
jgi:hypothetical protein